MTNRQPAVLYEDNHLLVLGKPAGMLSQGDRTGDPSVVDWAQGYLKERYRKPGAVYIGLVHRLDRPVSGVMVLARTSKAAGRLSTAFRERGATLEKRYVAWVEGVPEAASAALEGHMLPGKGSARSRLVGADHTGAKRVALHLDLLQAMGDRSLVEIGLETGRKHQIRVQLAAEGHPIIGDRRYGARSAYRPGAIALHAARLTIPHPIGGRPATFEAPPPTDWEQFDTRR